MSCATVKGKPVVGLGPNDFVLTENGVRQDIVDVAAVVPGHPLPSVVRPSGNSPHPAVSSTNEATPRDPTPTMSSTTALVFERLSPESRVAARAAALSVLQAPQRSDEFTGVFLLDLSLRTLQPFTTDRARQRAAVERASGAATSYFEANRVGIAKENAPATIGAEAGASGASIGSGTAACSPRAGRRVEPGDDEVPRDYADAAGICVAECAAGIGYRVRCAAGPKDDPLLLRRPSAGE